ncbi:hypothetical protein Tco_0630328 [Tanacetum coccineum]
MLVIKIFSERKKVFRERKKCEKIRAKRSDFHKGWSSIYRQKNPTGLYDGGEGDCRSRKCWFEEDLDMKENTKKKMNGGSECESDGFKKLKV